jgi:hypothetical protein
MFATRYRDDPRAVGVRSAVVQEGFDTICAAPLTDGADLLGRVGDLVEVLVLLVGQCVESA